MRSTTHPPGLITSHPVLFPAFRSGEYCARKSALSRRPSLYSTSMPDCSVKASMLGNAVSSSERSMYAGQFSHATRPEPSSPGWHAAMMPGTVASAPTATTPRPMRRMKVRRVRRSRRSIWSIAISIRVRSMGSLIGLSSRMQVGFTVDRGRGGDDEGVLWLPGEADALSIRVRLAGAARLEVLCVDGKTMAVPRLDEVLGADPDVRRVEHGALDRIRVGASCLGVVVGDCHHAELLGADAEANVSRAVDEGGWRVQHRSVGQLQRRVAVVATGDLRVEQVADTEEPGHEAGRRALVQLLGRAELLDLS